MSRKSRLLLFAVAVLLFGAGLAGAYVRCLNAWPVFEETSMAATASGANAGSGDKVVHCPKDRSPYWLIQAHRSLQKHPQTDRVLGHKCEALGWLVADSPSLANYTLSRFRPPLASTFWYLSIAIYQSKVVYRI